MFLKLEIRKIALHLDIRLLKPSAAERKLINCNKKLVTYKGAKITPLNTIERIKGPMTPRSRAARI